MTKNQAPVKTISLELVQAPAPPSSLVTIADGAEFTRADRIVAYHNATRLAEATKKIAAFFTGVELLQLKTEMGHGKFIPWCESNLGPRGLSYRTANRYMAFAGPHTGAWLELCRGEAATALQITNGLVTEETFKAACAFLKNADDGKIFSELSRDFGLSRLPQKQKHNPPRLTADQLAADRQAQALVFADGLIAELATFDADPQLHADLPTPKLKELHDAILTSSRHLRDLLKSRKSTKPKKVGRVAPRAPNKKGKK